MDWMKHKKIYFAVSVIVIAIGVFSLLTWGLKIGIDFKGGTIIEYKISKEISGEEIREKINSIEVEVNSVQKTSTGTYLLRLGSIDNEKKEKIKEELVKVTGSEIEELRFETVGAFFGPELVRKTIYGMLIAALVILLWVAYQFKSYKFGISAILAMFHDTLVVIGMYSLFGHFWQAEVDFLFVTALLTILSFSVHDTIVVYDRIRESQRKIGGSTIELANKAVTETMVRSLNNSFTIVFMLIALVLFGGSTIKWFAIVLLIGTISGTYSSPFVAVPLLVTWDELLTKIKIRK